MKKIITIIVIILLAVLIYLGWFSKNAYFKNKDIIQTPEQALDQATQADTTEDIDKNINSMDIGTSSEIEFKDVDNTINSI